jgi:formylmethanofuran dehydrogenase subunit E
MKEEKRIIAESAKKIDIKKCPKCNERIIIPKEDYSEVFICKNCSFKVKK